MCYILSAAGKAYSSMSVPHASRSTNPKSGSGFTLIELLVVVSIIAILASLILPALARAKARAQGSFCLSNNRQLAMAWMLYADEHEGQLAYNLARSSRITTAVPAVGGPQMAVNWVNNVLNWETTDTDNTNYAAVVETGLGPYTSKSAALYRCPSDNVLSDSQVAAGWKSRVRSYSMNAMIGDVGNFTQGGTNLNNPDYVQFFKIFTIPNPSDTFVFLDEHPDSIDDGYFLETPDSGPKWTDLPASYHDGAASFSFVDGHSELHRWHKGTIQPAHAYSISPALPMPIANTFMMQDYSWILSKMSVERNPASPWNPPPGYN